jgi:Endonuclease-reverse transcriptase
VTTFILQPDIILLTETWTNGNISDAMLQLPGYKLEVRRDRHDTHNGIGGGLVIYVKECLDAIPVPAVENQFNQYCMMSIGTKNGNVNFILVYRPPSSNAENLSLLCDLLIDVKSNTIVVGDFNLPGIPWDEQKAEGQARRFLETTETAGLAQLVNFPTHKRGNILDLVLSNCPEKISTVNDMGCLGSSDHCMIMLKLEISKPRIEQAPYYLWKKGKYDEIKDELRTINWDEKFSGATASEAWDIFKAKMLNLVDRFVPKIAIKGPGRPKWMTRDIKKMVNQKRKAWKI